MKAATALCLALVSAALAQTPLPQQQPADVSGNWTIYSIGGRGTRSTQYIQLQQNGNTLTGHFKGPNQSGGLQGTIDQQHIVFHTRSRTVLTFEGRVEGPRSNGRVEGVTITGNFHSRFGPGQWQATRAGQSPINPD